MSEAVEWEAQISTKYIALYFYLKLNDSKSGRQSSMFKRKKAKARNTSVY